MISVLIPTRGRPQGLLRVIKTALDTCRNLPEFIVYLDDDDTSYDQFNLEPAVILRGPRIVLSNMWNKCAEKATGDILLQGNDDIVFRTPGWDAIVEDAFAGCADKILMVHGSDGSSGRPSAHGGFGVHPFIHRKWVETLGYFTAPFFSSDFGDTWINDLANAIDRRRCVPILIEHMHFVFGKADVDATTSERLQRHSADQVEQLYQDLAPLRTIDIAKLRAVMQ